MSTVLRPSVCEGLWDKVCVTNVDDGNIFAVKLYGSEVKTRFKLNLFSLSISTAHWSFDCNSTVSIVITTRNILFQQSFVEMMNELQTAGTTSNKESLLKVDRPVIAKFSFDQQWYRAVIKGEILFSLSLAHNLIYVSICLINFWDCY